ncbi:SURF1 family protein [Aestuariivirga sp.]|uniref:SURF1 family protein n=1 Tax=Aestuariivirga sp. TaxID=2650926 RepID=UPI00391B732F
MRPHERPPRLWPFLLASLIGIAILVGLGFWQVQRLQWKEGLLAQLAANAAAPPVDLATAEGLAAQGRDPEFVRVKFRGSYRHDAWKKMIATYEGGQGWTIITPAVSEDGHAVIVDRGRLPGQRLENFERPEGEVEIEGVIRTYRGGQGYFDPANDAAANLWYWWDVPAMLAASQLPPGLTPFPFVVQLLPASTAAEFPRPQEPQANLANNHLGYAITWFGLAATLAAVAGFYVYELKRRRMP